MAQIRVRHSVSGALLPVSNVAFAPASTTQVVFSVGTVVGTGLAVLAAGVSVDVAVSNDGSSWGNTRPLLVYIAPLVLSVEPEYIPASGGTVTIAGAGFALYSGQAPKVSFGAGKAMALTVVLVDPAHLTASQTPVLSAGSHHQVFASLNTGGTWTTDAVFVMAFSILSIQPQAVPLTGRAAVTLTGLGFGPASTLSCKVGQGAASAAVFVSSTTVLCPAPAALAGSAAIEVSMSPGEFTATSGGSSALLYYKQPLVTAITPVATGPAPGGGVVSLLVTDLVATPMTVACRFASASGSAIVPATSVTLGALPTDPSTVNCTAPAQPCPLDPVVTVTVAPDGETFPGAGVPFSYFTLLQASPTGGSPGSTVTITGSGFLAAAAGSARCTLAGSTTAAAVVSAGTLTCALPQSSPAGPQTLSVSFDGGATSSSLSVTVLPPYTAPSASPLFGRAEGGTLVTVTGTGFSADPAVWTAPRCIFASTYVVASVLSATTVTCLSPPGFAATALRLSPNGGAESVAVATFSYFGLTGITPVRGPASGSTRVTVTGFGFSTDPNILICRFDGSLGTIVSASAQAMVCLSPPGPNPAGSASTLRVSSNAGVEFSFRDYLYYADPVIRSLLPPAGPQSGGTLVTLVGENFLAGVLPDCSFGALASRQVSLVPGSPNMVTCASPPFEAPLVPSLSFNGQNRHSGPAFNYYAFFGFEPLSGPLSGGSLVTVRGTGFSAAVAGNASSASCVFSVGGGGGAGPARAAPVLATVLSDSLLVCRSPAFPAPPLAARVRAALQSGNATVLPPASASVQLFVSVNGGSDLSPASPAPPGTPGTVYIAYRPPVLSSIDPRNGPMMGDIKVTVSGNDFTDTPQRTSCRFGTTPSPSSVFVSSTAIVCVAPPGPVPTVEVTLTSNGQDYTLPASGGAGSFNYSGCPAGRASPAFNVPCLDCPAGQFNPLPNQLNCSYCDATSYQDRVGSTTCLPCPANSKSFPGADRIAACACIDTYYRKTSDDSEPCLPCPKGAVCFGDSVEAQPGFYKDPANPSVFHPCEPPSVCTGVPVGFNASGINSGSGSRRGGGALGCREGHEGEMCRECSPGYYHSGLLCERCPGNAALLVIPVFIVGALAVVLLIFLGGERQAPYSGSLLMIASFAQTVTMSLNIELRWPSLLKSVRLGFTGPYTLDFAVPQCSFTALTGVHMAWDVKWALSIISPAIIGLGFLLVWVVVIGYSALLRRGHPPTWTGPLPPQGATRNGLFTRIFRCPVDRARFTNRVINGLLLFLLGAYLMLVRDTLLFFACTSEKTLAANSTYVCFSSWWWRRFPLALLGLLVYVFGIPATCFWAFRARKKAAGSLGFFQRFGMIYRHYEKDYVYWEMVVCFRKIGVAVGSLFFSSCPLCQIAFQVFFIVNCGLVHAYIRPFMLPRHNTTESVMLGLNCLVVLAGLSFAEGDLSSGVSSLIEWLCIIIVAGGCLSLGLVWAHQYFKPQVVRKKRIREQDAARSESMMTKAALGITQGIGRQSTGNFTDIVVANQSKESLHKDISSVDQSEATATSSRGKVKSVNKGPQQEGDIDVESMLEAGL